MEPCTTNKSGAPQYKTSTPLKLHDRTTAISKVVDPGIPRREDEHEAGAMGEESGPRFAGLAQINWRVANPSVIHFRGQELATTTFFRKHKDGKLPGRLVTTRLFTGTNTKEYKWILGAYTSEASHAPYHLKLNDDSETMVAKYRHKKLGHFWAEGPDKCSLEVSPGFKHMLDEILVTFVYIEQLRKSRDGSQSIFD
ncbi:hypothetical protein K438DRAFT_2135653 [Mycena galopus ATCC 62051]|nr:hypothetical protein K438DRAFT_2135653 [Mycena galopus ATCC 62051]